MTASSPVPAPLSPSGRRAVAAVRLSSATMLPPFACTLLVDTLDALCWTLLSVAGCTPAESRELLRELWVHDPDVTA